LITSCFGLHGTSNIALDMSSSVAQIQMLEDRNSRNDRAQMNTHNSPPLTKKPPR